MAFTVDENAGCAPAHFNSGSSAHGRAAPFDQNDAPGDRLDRRIALAYRHVASGLEILDGQRQLIERWTARKWDATAAVDLLNRFEQTEAIFEDDLERLLADRYER